MAGERQRERRAIEEGEKEMARWVDGLGGCSIWCHAAINKLYEKTRDIYLIMEYLRNHNETHTLSHYC